MLIIGSFNDEHQTVTLKIMKGSKMTVLRMVKKDKNFQRFSKAKRAAVALRGILLQSNPSFLPSQVSFINFTFSVHFDSNGPYDCPL